MYIFILVHTFINLVGILYIYISIYIYVCIHMYAHTHIYIYIYDWWNSQKSAL